jgi:HAD superfamily hydrolase (TIGR01484 family)
MKKLIAFDLDDTLAVTKSPISDEMSGLLAQLLDHFDVCVISGGRFEQFELQVTKRLAADPQQLRRLHLMPTCGTQYYRYDIGAEKWERKYAEGLSDEQKKRISQVLEEGAKKLGYWPKNPAGEVIEDRFSQITFSALGQQAKPEDKYAWDPDGKKKHALRDYAAPLLPDVEVRVGGTTSVDVTMIGIDKAYGMQKLIEELQISKEDILFLGDKLEEGGNDYPVKAMGIDSLEVSDSHNTEQILTGLLHVL